MSLSTFFNGTNIANNLQGWAFVDTFWISFYYNFYNNEGCDVRTRLYIQIKLLKRYIISFKNVNSKTCNFTFSKPLHIQLQTQ